MYHESIESVFFRLPPDERFPIVRKLRVFPVENISPLVRGEYLALFSRVDLAVSSPIQGA